MDKIRNLKDKTDAIEGRRVEEILVEDGAIVESGEPIAVLSNTNLQLEVLGRGAHSRTAGLGNNCRARHSYRAIQPDTGPAL